MSKSQNTRAIILNFNTQPAENTKCGSVITGQKEGILSKCLQPITIAKMMTLSCGFFDRFIELGAHDYTEFAGIAGLCSCRDKP